MARGKITLLAVTDQTLTRLAHLFRRSWRPLSANDNTPFTYWEMIQAAILTQDGEG